jgi:hypothetical protein
MCGSVIFMELVLHIINQCMSLEALAANPIVITFLKMELIVRPVTTTTEAADHSLITFYIPYAQLPCPP